MNPVASAIGRRGLGAAAWLGGLALAVPHLPAKAAAPASRMQVPPPLVVGIWTSIDHRTQEARVTVARMDPQGQQAGVLAAALIPAREVTSVAAVSRLGRAMALAEVARLWNLGIEQCAVTGATIHDSGGSRCARLLEWTDFV